MLNYKMSELIRPPPTPVNYRILKKMKADGEIKGHERCQGECIPLREDSV
uniref:Uncharacterized protein n=1 Tax=Megaselia scalaris TaxID=36166 RepID=T1GKJ1_MEGSC